MSKETVFGDMTEAREFVAELDHGTLGRMLQACVERLETEHPELRRARMEWVSTERYVETLNTLAMVKADAGESQ